MESRSVDRDTEIIRRARAVLADSRHDEGLLRAVLADLVEAHERTVERAGFIEIDAETGVDPLQQASDRIQTLEEEVKDLNNTLDNQTRLMNYSKDVQYRELSFERAKLELLVRLGIGMASERDEARLLDLILEGAMELTSADGATFYLMTEQEDALEFRIVRNASLGIANASEPDSPLPFPNVPLYDLETGVPNHSNVVSAAVLQRETVNIPDAYNSQEYDFSGTKRFDEANRYRSVSFLTVPLTPRGGSVIGALQLINATDAKTGEVVPFDDEIQGFVEALAAQGAVTIENQKLLKAQRELIDAIVELTASAIDAKSPYTGGHCNRVPELAMMLGKAAHDSKSGPFADFGFAGDEEWREFRIAAWLHDCGKVTTPEYVVDKATKLETIYNRIHEVRTRFEVIRRDLTIDYLSNKLTALGGDPVPDDGLRQAYAQLEEEFEFLADCNIGGEFMEPGAIERVKSIAARKWVRHFDNRKGLSQDETLRLQGIPPTPVPADETLLSDRPSHVVQRDPGDITRFRESGFKMNIPENLTNLGEVYNLSIQRGTLTDEERFKINEHIIQTIIMLETMPFPKNMQRVPEYAGGHHETMDGKGYPRRLTRDEMSVPARIMAIADIFEALTASDRPYKKPKSLSESLQIMGHMCRDSHIDPDVFALFIDQKIYLRYAEDFLDPEQIDAVDDDALKAIADEMSAAATATVS